LGAVTADANDVQFAAGEFTVGGLLLGGAAGAAVGGITVLFKNSETFVINGDLRSWSLFQKRMQK
jgi:hypothetical protein